MEGYFTFKFLFATEIFFFFFARLFLLGGSSVKKLTELYDLTKLLCFGICRYRLSTKSFFLAYANLVIPKKLVLYLHSKTSQNASTRSKFAQTRIKTAQTVQFSRSLSMRDSHKDRLELPTAKLQKDLSRSNQAIN